MNFFRNLFKKAPPAAVTRQLEHVSQLLCGDIIEFSNNFSLPAAIRQQKFEVIAVETLEFEHQHYPRFKLQGQQASYLWLSLPGHDRLNFQVSMEIKRATVSQLFDLDEFSEIFEEGFSELTCLTATNLGDWHAPHYYQQDNATVGYQHYQDLRNSTPSPYADDAQGQQFEFYHLHDNQEHKILDIIVRDNGDTDIFLGMVLSTDNISGYWPRS